MADLVTIDIRFVLRHPPDPGWRAREERGARRGEGLRPPNPDVACQGRPATLRVVERLGPESGNTKGGRGGRSADERRAR